MSRRKAFLATLNNRIQNKKITLALKPQLVAKKKIRSVFKGIKTDDADHYIVRRVVSRGNRRLFFRVDRRGGEHTIRTYVAQVIFNRLYPQYSIAPVGVGTIVVEGKLLTGMFSRIIRKRSRSYREYQQIFYPEDKESETHTNFTKKEALPVSNKILLESSIRINDTPANVAESDGRPVFFEVAWIDPGYFRLYLEINHVSHEAVREWFRHEPPNQRATIKRILEQILDDKPKRVEIDIVKHREGNTKKKEKPN